MVVFARALWTGKIRYILDLKMQLMALNRAMILPSQANGLGVLLTADGGRYEGKLFGAEGVGEGELVFTTGMMGYQESLTDPSFADRF